MEDNQKELDLLSAYTVEFLKAKTISEKGLTQIRYANKIKELSVDKKHKEIAISLLRSVKYFMEELESHGIKNETLLLEINVLLELDNPTETNK